MLKNLINSLLLYFLLGSKLILALQINKPEMQFHINTSSTEASFVNIELKFYNHPKMQEMSFSINQDTMDRFRVYDTSYKRIRYRLIKDELKIKSYKSNFIIKYRSKLKNIPKNISTFEILPNFNLDETVLFFGYNMFIYPVYDSTLNIVPNIYVKFLFPKIWKIATSWGIGKKDYKISNFDTLHKAIIIAGNLKINKILVKSKPYYLIFQGKWSNIQNRFASIFKKISLKHIEYWNFLPSDFVLVNFIKNKKFNKPKGINYSNTLLYFMPEHVDLNDAKMLKLLAHEHFHIWNGYYIFPFENNEKDLLWFKEGLTDYYALLTLIKTQIISKEVFLNELLDQYIKYSSQNTIDETLKGFFICLALDMEIRKGTNNNKSLDDFLDKISIRNEFWQRGYNLADIKSELLKLYYWDISDFFDKFLNNNKINVDSYFDFLEINISKVDDYSYKDDFEIRKYKSGTSYVYKINNDSSAYENGLRKRDIILSYNKAKKYPEKSIIKIKRRNKELEIKFIPWLKIKNLVLISNKDNKYFNSWTNNK